jgi:Tfp pilus assembly protein PilX
MARYIFRRGSALVTCTIVLVIVSVMAVSLAAVSGANLEVAVKQKEGNLAFSSSESGLEVMHYWLSRVRVPSLTPTSQYFSTIVALAQSDLAAHGITNFQVNADGAIPQVTLSSVTRQDFRGQWSPDASNPTILQVTSSGTSGQAARTIGAQFTITPYRFPIFNYGIATKGPLVLKYNPKFLAATQGWEADIYVESDESAIAVDIGKNATLAGNLAIGNPDATVSCGGTLTMGGTLSHIAEEDRPEFPVPNVQHFLQYATGPVIGPATNLSSGGSMTFANAVVAPNTNPVFATNVTLQGILYIKAPNRVTFAKNITVQGMIVAEGDVDNPGTNQIRFGDPSDPSTPSNFSSGPYPAGAQFDALRQEQGSCILAPGFALSFNKNFSAINGVIAASGLYFANNASATVKGTLINYSEQGTVVERNINLTFDRSAMVEIPAGFDLYRVLQYNPSSYAMVQ